MEMQKNETLQTKYEEYLTKGETPSKEFNVGSYKAVITNKRIILIKKFPKAFIPISYTSITNIEHHVYIHWGILTRSLILFALSLYTHIKSGDFKGLIDTFISFIEKNIPELAGIFSVISSDTLTNILQILLPSLALLYLLKFIKSLSGRLKISIKGSPSLRITTSMSKDVRNFIKLVETSIESGGEPVLTDTATDTEAELTELEPGHTYLVKEYRPEKSFKLFLSAVDCGCTGLYISRTNPEQIRKEHKLDTDFQLISDLISIRWLTESLSSADAIPPEPDQMFALISDFIRKNEKTVILLDGLEYLIGHANFEQILRFVQGLKDKIGVRDARMIIPINPHALSEKEMALLEREMNTVL